MSETGETPSNNLASTNGGRFGNISRRSFLKILGVITVAPSVRSSQPPDLPKLTAPPSYRDLDIQAEPMQSQVSETLEPKGNKENFELLGMLEFLPFYEKVKNITSKFGARDDGYYFNRIHTVCKKVASGELSDSGDQVLLDVRDGWGVKMNRVVDDALAHVQGLNVQNHSGEGNPEKFKSSQLTRFAQVFAPMSLALPKDIYLTDMGAETRADLLATMSFDQWGERAGWEAFFHEATHATDVWSDRVQPYVPKKKFLEYASTYYETTHNLLTDWLNTPAKDYAMSEWDVDIDKKPGNPQIVIANVERQLFNNEFASESINTRFMRVAWTAGKQILSIRSKQENNASLSIDEQNLLANPDVQNIMTWAVEECLHFLVSTPKDTFFSDSEQASDKVIQARKIMLKKRVETFASFKIDPIQDIGQQVRDQLMIDRPVMETESETKS